MTKIFREKNFRRKFSEKKFDEFGRKSEFSKFSKIMKFFRRFFSNFCIFPKVLNYGCPVSEYELLAPKTKKATADSPKISLKFGENPYFFAYSLFGVSIPNIKQ